VYYIAVHFEDRHCVGLIPSIGLWDNYYVYEIEADTISRLDFINTQIASIPNREIAYGWKFVDKLRGYIHVRDGGVMVDQIGREKLHLYKPQKSTYYITAEDRENGVKFAKIVLRAKIHRAFANIVKYTQAPCSHISSAYANYVYASNDDSLIADLETNMHGLASTYKNYNKHLRYIAGEMHNLERMVDNITTVGDIGNVQGQIMLTVVDLPKTLEINGKTSHV